MTYEYAFWYLLAACFVAFMVLLYDGEYTFSGCLILAFGGLLWPFSLLFLMLVLAHEKYTDWRVKT